MLLWSLILPFVTAASLAPRQGQPGDTSTTDPRLTACSTTCASTYPIYDLCTARQAGCEQICYLANWDLFTQCQQCLLDQTDQVNQGMLTSAQGVITKLATACTNNGTAVTPVQMTAALAAAASQTAKLGDDYRGGTNPQSGRFAAGAAEGNSSPFTNQPNGGAIVLPHLTRVAVALGSVAAGVALL